MFHPFSFVLSRIDDADVVFSKQRLPFKTSRFTPKHIFSGKSIAMVSP
jgi:hypothetical protein